MDDERARRFSSDKEKNQAQNALRAADRALQEERRLRLELCQVFLPAYVMWRRQVP